MNLHLQPRADVCLLATAVSMPVDLAPAGQRGVVLDQQAVLARMPGVRAEDALRANDTEVATRQWVQDADAIDLAVDAAQRALAKAGLQAADLAGLICASSTPVSISAAMAPRIASRLGCGPGVAQACALDVRAGGMGAVLGWFMAQGLIAQGAGPVLVVAAETPSRFLRPDDVGTALRYGDGAGACILGPCRPGAPTFLGGLSGQRPLGGRPTTVPGRLPPDGDADLLDYRFQKPDREHLQALAGLWAACPGWLAEAFPSAAASTRFVLPYAVSHQQMASVVAGLGAPGASAFHGLRQWGCLGAASPLAALHGLLASGQAAAGDVVALIAAAGNGVWGGFFWALDERVCAAAGEPGCTSA